MWRGGTNDSSSVCWWVCSRRKKKKEKVSWGGVKGRKLTEEEAPVLKEKHAGIPPVCFCIWHLLSGFHERSPPHVLTDTQKFSRVCLTLVFAENYSKITKVKSLKMVFIHSASWKIQEYLNMQTVSVFNIWYFPHHIYVRWILDRIWLLSYLWCHKSCWKARLLKVQFVKKVDFWVSLPTRHILTFWVS